METYKRLSGLKQVAVAGTMGAASVFSLGGCDLGEFTTTTTTTLDGREVVTYLVRAAILTPIDNFLTNAIDAFFDELEDQD
jgi:hypothetical protein